MNSLNYDFYLREFFESLPAKEAVYQDMRFRKWRMNAYTNKQKSESRFRKRFEQTYGSPDTTTVFLGDWSTHGHTLRGQVPSKCVGFRKMFRRWGYGIYLVDEFKTSKVCSGCQGILESSGVFRVNPKPHRNDVREVHGLLRCQSETCKSHVQNVNPMLAGVACRYWNRDVNSARNIRIIVTHTVRHGERPAPYRRG